MKRCPECWRDYYDDSLLYCLDDGRALLEGPGGIHSTAAPGAEPATVRLHSTEPPNGEPATRLFSSGSGECSDNANAVAVLPFANLSRNEDSEYFSDGLAEEILNVLSKIRGLRVAARTSAFAFKGKQVSVKEIGRALDVSSVLEGSVRMAGERVRIAVQLVSVKDGYHLWSETYDRTMDDIFAIQDDIARSVVEELRSQLLGKSPDPNLGANAEAEVQQAVKGRAADPEAHRLMLLGRHLLDRMNEADAIKAVGYFQQALEIDPDYAVCWAQLGRAFFLASNYGWSDLDTDYQRAEEALQRALDLEPDLAEGNARLGRVRWYRDGDFINADQGLRRALALAPENIEVLLGAGNMAMELGQFEEAIDHCRRAVAVDPLSSAAWSTTAYTNFLAGDLSASESDYRRTLELAPQRTAVHASLGLVLMRQGYPDEALAEALLEPENYWRCWSLAIIHYTAGRSSESDAELHKIVQFGDSAAFQAAEVHSMSGETDKAFEWLERAIDQRDPGRLNAKVSPLLKPLHDDPRWAPLLKRSDSRIRVK